MIEDGLITPTSVEQGALERRISALYSGFVDSSVDDFAEQLQLTRSLHISYLYGGLQQLPAGFVVLDSSRPWICYWIIHSLALLDAPLPPEVSPEAVIDFLAHCQDAEGGFGGGPSQLPHLAPTYAAVASLVTLGGNAALEVINRDATFSFLQQRAVVPAEGGGFTVCEGGEVDVRGAYTALATAHMLKLDKVALAKQAGVVQYVCKCQTYEGGLGGEPGNEAHGGYTFCGLAALMLVGEAHQLNLPSLVHWAVHMQGQVEGGFMGRTNKLVDGCYSFWQGGIFPLLRMLMPDYLAQTHIPTMPGVATATEDDNMGSSSSETTVGSNEQGAASSGQRVASSGQQLSSSGQDASSSEAHGAQAGDDAGCLLGPESSMSEGVMSLEGRDPVVRALNDLHRTKVEAESAEEAATRAEAAQASGQAADNDDTVDTSELHHKAQRLRTRAGGLQEAVQCALQNTDDIEATAALLCTVEDQNGEPDAPHSNSQLEQTQLPLLYNVQALQLWLLKCCQAPKGGMRDKPGKPPDYYHTCYCLSGLSSSQNFGGCVLGRSSNKLVKADPLCNVVQHKLDAALAHVPVQSECL